MQCAALQDSLISACQLHEHPLSFFMSAPREAGQEAPASHNTFISPTTLKVTFVEHEGDDVGMVA